MPKNNVAITTLALISLVSFGYSFANVMAGNASINQQNTQLYIKDEIEQDLLKCGYTPECIKLLDLAYPTTNPNRQILDELLIKHYYDEISHALTTIAPDKQLLFIEQEKTKCCLSPNAIARGQEGPCLMYTKDGSDRGALGRRFKAYSQLEADLISENNLRKN